MLAEGRARVILHFTDLEVLRIAMEEEENHTEDENLKIRNDPMQESELLSHNIISPGKSLTSTNADCKPCRSKQPSTSRAPKRRVSSKMTSRCKSHAVANNGRPMLQSGRPATMIDLTNEASSSMIPTVGLKSSTNTPGRHDSICFLECIVPAFKYKEEAAALRVLLMDDSFQQKYGR
jgi:hypothetical protein